LSWAVAAEEVGTVFNWILLVPLVGACLVGWGLIRKQRTVMWLGVALIGLFLALGVIDRTLGG
jgi:hypothetical protein